MLCTFVLLVLIGVKTSLLYVDRFVKWCDNANLFDGQYVVNIQKSREDDNKPKNSIDIVVSNEKNPYLCTVTLVRGDKKSLHKPITLK